MIEIDRRSFADREALAEALAATVADRIGSAIAGRGRAVIAVSGGSTPARFFAELSRRRDIDWRRVVVTLVDERWVPDGHERSNARLVMLNLLTGDAILARLVPLYAGGAEPDARAIERTNAALAEIADPFAAVVLGMGADGHTASFFPGGDSLGAALTERGPAIAIRAPGAGEPRVTLTLPRLLDTDGLYLHIEGEGKAEVLDAALSDGPIEDLPVRAVLRSGRPVTVYWCP